MRSSQKNRQTGPTPETEEVIEAAQEGPIAIEAPAEEALQADEVTESGAEILSPDPAAALETPEELAAALEAILFATPEPLSVKKMGSALGDIPTARITEALEGLIDRYQKEGRGIQIVEIPGGYQMATQERFAEFIMALGSKKKPPSLSNATLETLAIVAYRQPITRAAIEAIRGVESSGTLRNLLDMEMIEITGRQEVIGRPPIYGTTDKFLRAFGLRRIKDLPSIRGLRERFLKTEQNPLVPAPAAIAESAGDVPQDEAISVEPEIEAAPEGADPDEA